MPGVLDIMALDSEAEEKAARRQRELDLQVTARIECTWGIHFGGSTCNKDCMEDAEHAQTGWTPQE